MADGSSVQVGDKVVYCHQHLFSKVDSYSGQVVAVHENGACDIQVNLPYNTIVKNIRYSEEALPSSWHNASKREENNHDPGSQ
jgi:hypothetical protein